MRPGSFAMALLTSAGLLTAPEASAAPCGRPDVDFALPPDGASDVPAAARLLAHYTAPASYDDEPVELTDGDGGALAASVVYDAAANLLLVFPSEPLPRGPIQLSFPGLRGVSGSGVGQGKRVSFTVGDRVDREPPVFDGLTHVDWSLRRETDPCLDKLTDRFAFELELGRVEDDLGRDLLSLQVFETHDPAAPEDPPELVSHLPLPARGPVTLLRPASHVGKTCFAAVVEDSAGAVSSGAEEVCTTTRRPPFFEGCGLCPAQAPRRAGVALMAALALAGRRRKRALDAEKPPTPKR